MVRAKICFSSLSAEICSLFIIHDDDKTNIHMSDPIQIIIGIILRETYYLHLVQIIIHSLVNTTLSHIIHLCSINL